MFTRPGLCLTATIASLVLLPAHAALAQQTGSVIFFHPDGTSANSWAAARMFYYGPDGDLHWDRLPHIALYRGHLADCLTATSNAGATIHAYGIKTDADSFGKTAGGGRAKPIVDADGHSLSVAHQAMRAGIPVGLVQSGSIIEPGTAVFVASADSRRDFDSIAAQVVESGVTLSFSGGEQHFLPAGVKGVHGPGTRKDQRNLIDEARERGYKVIFTREELLALPAETEKVIGLFASYHTFNDKPEEKLAELGLEPYDPKAPTIAEMMDVALKILGRNGRQFLAIVEEEGTDNLPNNNNAIGTLIALKRADDAIGVARAFLQQRPDTLLFTAADSDAGGLQVIGFVDQPGKNAPEKLPERDESGAMMDGTAGTGTAPFTAAPDRMGRQLKFAIVWAAADDVSGGILVRADGFNAHLVKGSFDNTKVAELIRTTLFGAAIPASPAKPPAAD